MFRFLRNFHKWIGIGAFVFLTSLALTGFFLALKSELPWMRPPVQKTPLFESTQEVASIHSVLNEALSHQLDDLRELKHVDRVDYRPKDNVFKVTSKIGYSEVQVSGSTGKTLSIGHRTDQLMEDIHDLSFFHDKLRITALPVVGLGLLLLSITGLCMFLTPILRRRSFEKRQKNSPQ